MQTEPIYVEHVTFIGNGVLKLTGEKWDGVIGDTRVEIDGPTICFISWDEKDKFISDFKELITKYAI